MHIRTQWYKHLILYPVNKPQLLVLIMSLTYLQKVIDRKNCKLYISFSKINYDNKFLFNATFYELYYYVFFTLSLSNYRKLNNNILQNIFLLYIKNNVNMTHQLYYSFCYMYVIIIISRNYILPP